MHIAMIGNINNASFLLGGGLRELGQDVRLLVTRNERLHHPVLAGLVDELPDWVYDGSSVGLAAYEQQDASIAAALEWLTHKADLVILNDTGPSLHNLFPMPAVSFLTGSDLTYYGSLSSSHARRANWGPGFVSTVQGLMDVAAWEEMVARQRAGIRRSCVVCYPWRGMLPESDAVLDEIGVEDSRRICLLNIDTPRIRPTQVPAGRPLKIFNGARLNWVDPLPTGFSEQDHKGSDKLLHGFSAFLERGGQGELTLVEKGLHVAETRALAAELGLEPYVVWKPEMTMAEFYGAVATSHLICCNLGRSILGQASLIGMSAGRPVLANFGLEHIQPHFRESWPVLEAKTPEDVADHMWMLYQRPERRAQIGEAARRFAETYLSPKGAAKALMERLATTLPQAALEAPTR
jgi:glycosyltransferase involved in cell wall biosynthesis